VHLNLDQCYRKRGVSKCITRRYFVRQLLTIPTTQPSPRHLPQDTLCLARTQLALDRCLTEALDYPEIVDAQHSDLVLGVVQAVARDPSREMLVLRLEALLAVVQRNSGAYKRLALAEPYGQHNYQDREPCTSPVINIVNDLGIN